MPAGRNGRRLDEASAEARAATRARRKIKRLPLFAIAVTATMVRHVEAILWCVFVLQLRSDVVLLDSNTGEPLSTDGLGKCVVDLNTNADDNVLGVLFSSLLQTSLSLTCCLVSRAPSQRIVPDDANEGAGAGHPAEPLETRPGARLEMKFLR